LKTIYLDTNVFLKLFFVEDFGKEQAEKITLLAKQNKATVAISQGVINECIAAVERKKNEGKITEHQIYEILTSIADTIEGNIEQINLSIYPISEKVIFGSRATIMDIHCSHATDALHIFADLTQQDQQYEATIIPPRGLAKPNWQKLPN
jgi:predicted nucleic acid-binding protein